jgi:hypothetical protein
MLKRYKTGKQGDFSTRELSEIWSVTNIIVAKSYSRDEGLTELEIDYVKYVRSSLWVAGRFPFLAAGVMFVIADTIPVVARKGFLARWGCKFGLLAIGISIGVQEIKKDILKFPLLNEVITQGVVKYSKWIEVQT